MTHLLGVNLPVSIFFSLRGVCTWWTECFIDKKNLEPTYSSSSSPSSSSSFFSCLLFSDLAMPLFSFPPLCQVPLCLQADVSFLNCSLHLATFLPYGFLTSAAMLFHTSLSFFSLPVVSQRVFLYSGVMLRREIQRSPLGHFGTLSLFVPLRRTQIFISLS